MFQPQYFHSPISRVVKRYCFGTTSSTKDPMRVRILTERAVFLWLHPLKHIVMSKSSSHVTGFYRLTKPAVGSRERHLYIVKM